MGKVFFCWRKVNSHRDVWRVDIDGDVRRNEEEWVVSLKKMNMQAVWAERGTFGPKFGSDRRHLRDPDERTGKGEREEWTGAGQRAGLSPSSWWVKVTFNSALLLISSSCLPLPATASLMSTSGKDSDTSDNVVRIRGLPWQATKDDIFKFFSGKLSSFSCQPHQRRETQLFIRVFLQDVK